MKVTPQSSTSAMPSRKPLDPSTSASAPASEAARTTDQATFTGIQLPKLGPESLVEQVREALARQPYRIPDLPSLEAAIAWQPGAAGLSGSQANAVINQTYHHLSAGLDRYLGEPSLPNWMTFGQYASREAGTQIDSLEDAFTALHTVKNSRDPLDIYRAVSEAMGHLSPEVAKQVLKLTRSQVDMPSLGDVLEFGLHPGVGLTGEVVELFEETLAAVERLHTALVRGNVGIYANMAPAYDIFLKAESEGQDGLEALRQNGYAPGSENDPQGFVNDAFTRYQEARELGKKAESAPFAEREALLRERQALIHEANLYIGIQGQMVILQAPEIYGDPEVAEVVNAQGELSLTDPTGTHRLAANWADFATRMGFETVAEGTPGALAIRDHQGQTAHYRLPEPPPAGSIAAYFAAGLAPATARALLAGSPRPL